MRSPRAHRPDRALAALLAAIAALCGARASAQEAPSISCQPLQGALRCALLLSPAFDATVQSKLRTGLLNRFFYRIYIRRVEDDEPVNLAILEQFQVFELWDELYYLSDDRGAEPRLRTPQITEAITALATFDGLLISEPIPPGRYYADLIVELNPLSEEDEAAIRSWIARNRGGHRTFASGGRSLFGTFVSLFINIRPGNAEWSLRARSRPFTIPEATP
jgi:hypothetical protein